MQNNALTDIQRALLRDLGGSGDVQDFYLAGGTALAVQLSHRISEDLDFFSLDEFDVEDLHRRLLKHLDVKHVLTERQTLIVEINAVRTSFMHYPYQLLKPRTPIPELVKLASIEDIATMKLATIAARGAKRDFIDMYVICTECFGLQEALKMYEKKFGVAAADRYHVLRSLAYFQDAEVDPMPKTFRDITWPELKKFFVGEVKKVV